MLDIQFIRENPELVKEKSAQKGYSVDVGELLRLDGLRKELQVRIDEIRTRRNAHADTVKMQGKPTQEQIDHVTTIKAELEKAETEFSDIDSRWLEILKAVPNMPLEGVPVGSTEEENVVVKTVGKPKTFDFDVKNHAEIAEAKGWLDKERAAKVAGSRFAYIKGDLVRMQFAIVQFVFDVLSDETTLKGIIDDNSLNISSKPFNPVLPPAIVNTTAYEATARLDAEEVTYKLADDEMWLNASACSVDLRFALRTSER